MRRCEFVQTRQRLPNVETDRRGVRVRRCKVPPGLVAMPHRPDRFERRRGASVLVVVLARRARRTRSAKRSPIAWDLEFLRRLQSSLHRFTQDFLSALGDLVAAQAPANAVDQHADAAMKNGILAFDNSAQMLRSLVGRGGGFALDAGPHIQVRSASRPGAAVLTFLLSRRLGCVTRFSHNFWLRGNVSSLRLRNMTDGSYSPSLNPGLPGCSPGKPGLVGWNG